MKQAALVYMVTHFTTQADQIKLKASFQQFDTNQDGTISLDEFIQAYQKAHPDRSADLVAEEATKIFKQTDADSNGSIDYEEWCIAN